MWAITTTGTSDFSEGLVSKSIVEILIKLVQSGTDGLLRRLGMQVLANLLTCDDRVKMMLMDEGGLDMVYEAFVQNP